MKALDSGNMGSEENEALSGRTAQFSRERPLAPDQAFGALAGLARAAERPDLAVEADALAQRTAEGRFYVACIGQFKRGKSTLLNALVGDAVLPVGVVPVTSAITIVRFGPEARARARFSTGEWRDIDVRGISQYVSEEENPENTKGVLAVEVMLPSPLLASGMCLVDTPGIGSVFAGNTAVTRDFVPHIDAALVVVGADPPIAGEELSLVIELSGQVGELLFVLNKADRLTDIERRQAVEFTCAQVSKRIGRPSGTIFEISATERLGGRPTRDWTRLVERLEQLATQSGAALVRRAQRRGATRLRDRIVHELDERIGALTRPFAESQARLATLERCLTEAEIALQELGHRLNAEQERLARTFAERRQMFLEAALPAARAELATALSSTAARGRALRRQAIALAQTIAKERLEPRLREEEAAAEALYRASMQRFVVLADEFMARLAASNALEIPPARADDGAELLVKSRFFLHELLTIVPDSPATRVADALRPRRRALVAIEQAVGRYLERMLQTNSARIQNDLTERVLESRRLLEADLRARLREVQQTAQRALSLALGRHAEGHGAVRAEIERLRSLRRGGEALCVADEPSKTSICRGTASNRGTMSKRGHDE